MGGGLTDGMGGQEYRDSQGRALNDHACRQWATLEQILSIRVT